MTYKELQDNVNNWLGNRADISETLVAQTVNNKYRGLAIPFKFRGVEGTEEITTTSGQDFVNLVTDDVYAANIVRDMTNKNKIDKKDIEYYEGLDDTTLKGRPEIFVQYGNKIILYPVPSGEYILRVRLVSLPAKMVDDTDAPVYPEDWHKAIEYEAASELAFMFNMDERGMMLQNRFLAHIASRQEEHTLDRRQIQGQAVVKRTR